MGLKASDISIIRRGERMACVEEIRRMAMVANSEGYGITYEGGIDTQDAARIMEACARVLEGSFDAQVASPSLPNMNTVFEAN